MISINKTTTATRKRSSNKNNDKWNYWLQKQKRKKAKTNCFQVETVQIKSGDTEEAEVFFVEMEHSSTPSSMLSSEASVV